MKTTISIAFVLLLLVVTATPGRAFSVLVKNHSTFSVDVLVGSNPEPKAGWNVVTQLNGLKRDQVAKVPEGGKYVTLVLVSYSAGQGWVSTTAKCDIRVVDPPAADTTLLLEGSPLLGTFQCTYVK